MANSVDASAQTFRPVTPVDHGPSPGKWGDRSVTPVKHLLIGEGNRGDQVIATVKVCYTCGTDGRNTPDPSFSVSYQGTRYTYGGLSQGMYDVKVNQKTQKVYLAKIPGTPCPCSRISISASYFPFG